MKKHSQWRKNRRTLRELGRAALRIIRADKARADWFSYQKERSIRDCPGYGEHIDIGFPERRFWPFNNFDDLFVRIEPTPKGVWSHNSDVAPGIYSVLYETENSVNTQYSNPMTWCRRLGELDPHKMSLVHLIDRYTTIIPCDEVN